MEIFNIKEMFNKYTKNKKIVVLVIIFIIGLILISLPDNKSNNKADTINLESSLRESEEKRLEKIITSVDGVSKCRVMISFLDNGVKEYYRNEQEDRDDSNLKTQRQIVVKKTDGNEEPILKREISPVIKGVSIVADCKRKGMEDIIYSITSKALGVDIHKIQVVINDRS
ncbi:MAG: hypothetical protein E7405_01455 [Ruminococcaceae bacterium]|nr:hypothetical protein [Oscillospiraceae bacterium]